MDRAAVTSAIAQLIARVEELQTENADLRAKNQDCAKTVARLVARVENLQSVQAELKMKLHAHPAHSYRKRPPVMRGRMVQTNVG